MDKEGRYAVVTGRMYDSYITLINVYSPPEEGPNMLSKVIKIIASESKGMVILGGDLMRDTQSNRQHRAIQAAKAIKRA